MPINSQMTAELAELKCALQEKVDKEDLQIALFNIINQPDNAAVTRARCLTCDR